LVAGRPGIDLALEKRVQRCLREAIKRGLLSSAHDVSDGGLAAALAECCIAGDIGFKGAIDIKGRLDGFLFGEGGARVVVSVPPAKVATLRRLAGAYRVPVSELGVVGGARIALGPISLPLADMAHAWRGGLEGALSDRLA
jgi:phosphoribosylformylglycinamidine synthase